MLLSKYRSSLPSRGCDLCPSHAQVLLQQFTQNQDNYFTLYLLLWSKLHFAGNCYDFFMLTIKKNHSVAWYTECAKHTNHLCYNILAIVSMSCTYTHTHTHTHTHKHALSLSLLHTHIHAQTHTHTHTHSSTPPPPHSHPHSAPPPPPTHTHLHLSLDLYLTIYLSICLSMLLSHYCFVCTENNYENETALAYMQFKLLITVHVCQTKRKTAKCRPQFHAFLS